MLNRFARTRLIQGLLLACPGMAVNTSDMLGCKAPEGAVNENVGDGNGEAAACLEHEG